MYIPAHFRKDDPDHLLTFIREHSFGVLVTQEQGAPFASHLPFLLDTAKGAYGALRAHMARANPHWQHFKAGQEALVIFQGPHAYISPSWYENHPSVPTWNYTAVHAYGIPRLLDAEELPAALRDSVAAYETPLPKPWSMESLTEEYIEKMTRAIVGFEIQILRLEGKFKLSQNRPEADRMGVIEALQQSGDPHRIAVAEVMRSED